MTGYLTLTAVTNGFTLFKFTYLEYGGFKGTYGLKRLVVKRIDSIQSKSQTYHVILDLRESLYCCRIAYMAYYMMLESRLKGIGRGIETFYLQFGERIKVRTVAANKMREYRARNDGSLTLQTAHQFGYIIRGKSQTVHSGVNLDMNGEIGYAVVLGGTDYHIQQVETVNLGFKFLVKQRSERCPFRIHDHYACGYSRLAQFGTLIGHSHSQIIHLTVLKRLGNLYRTGTVSRCLDHAYNLCFRFKHAAVTVQVIGNSLKVNLKYSLMNL